MANVAIQYLLVVKELTFMCSLAKLTFVIIV